MRTIRLAIWTLALSAAGNLAHAASLSYTIKPIGLFDAVHRNASGNFYSETTAANSSGYVLGTSRRYNGEDYSGQFVKYGNTAWLYDGAQVTALGLQGGQYVRSDGAQDSIANAVNDSGHVIGQSERYTDEVRDDWQWFDQNGRDAWYYDGNTTTRIGLYGGEYADDNGFGISNPTHINNTGQAAGFSRRYSGTTEIGQAAWVYRNGQTSKVGLYDARHTSATGRQQSFIYGLNEGGLTAGTSRLLSFDRDPATNLWRHSAWVSDGAGTTQVGLLDPENTSASGLSDTTLVSLEADGRLFGHSDRYSGDAVAGQTAWMYNNGSTTRLGLSGAEFVSTSGYQSSGISKVDEDGFVIGTSLRYSGDNSIGSAAWVLRDGAYTRAGLTDAAHTGVDGTQDSRINDANASGQLIGTSVRADPANGQTAWFFDGTDYTHVGLYDDDHTQNGQRQYSTATKINDAGIVVGISNRYRDDGEDCCAGQSTWYFNGSTTVRIGLYDDDHTRDDFVQFGAQQSSSIKFFNEGGIVAGTSERYRDDGEDCCVGQSAWVYNGSETIRVGLYDDDHTASREAYSTVTGMNELGQVIGYSERECCGFDVVGYGNPDARTAWLYDTASGEFFDMTMSISLDNYAYSEITHFYENGDVFGVYSLFDELTGEDLGQRAFQFNVETGLSDLGLLVDNLTEDGWCSTEAWCLHDSYDGIGNLLERLPDGSIVGHTSLALDDGVGTSGYVVTAVPLPPAVWLLGSALGLLGFRRSGRTVSPS